MNPFRRHRLRLRIAILAMLALLWSQTALAWHGLCAAELVPPSVQQADHPAGCHQTPPPPADHEAPLCAAHCDQDVPSPDTARIPALPAMPALVPALAVALLPTLPQTARHADGPPPIPWHRPTPHPAALLLI